MNEESQIEDMRAALRGDRERAEQARQRSTENAQALFETLEPEPAPEPETAISRGFFARLLGR